MLDLTITPPCPPMKDDLVEVAHEGEWQPATITEVRGPVIFGVVHDQPYPTSFGYTIASYRVNWRYR